MLNAILHAKIEQHIANRYKYIRKHIGVGILKRKRKLIDIQVIIWPRCASRSYWHLGSHIGPRAFILENI